MALLALASVLPASAQKSTLTFGSTNATSSNYALAVAMSKAIKKELPSTNVSMIETGASVDNIRRALRRERRDGDRRGDKLDHRIFPRERRVGERRGPPRDAHPDGDPLIDPAALDDMIIELLEEDMEEIEQTFVKGARPVKDPAEADHPSAKG